MKRLLIASFVLIVAAVALQAQVPVNTTTPADPAAVPKTISGGVLNGKAISLPKPQFPPAARAVGAFGGVSVHIVIDEHGNVMAASAASGHPLLRDAAVEAASAAKFSPTQLQGVPVRVSGVLTYNFVGRLYPARIGYLLGRAEQTGSFELYSSPGPLAYQLPEDWIREKELLQSMKFEDPPEEKANRVIKGGFDGVAANQASPYGHGKLDSQSLASLQNLLRAVEGRVSENPSSRWAYELGKALGAFAIEIKDESKLQSNLQQIESHLETAPTGIIQSSLRQVKEFATLVREQGINAASRRDVITKLEALSAAAILTNARLEQAFQGTIPVTERLNLI